MNGKQNGLRMARWACCIVGLAAPPRVVGVVEAQRPSAQRLSAPVTPRVSEDTAARHQAYRRLQDRAQSILVQLAGQRPVSIAALNAALRPVQTELAAWAAKYGERLTRHRVAAGSRVLQTTPGGTSVRVTIGHPTGTQNFCMGTIFVDGKVCTLVSATATADGLFCEYDCPDKKK